MLHFCVIILEIMSLDSVLIQVSDQALCIFGSHQAAWYWKKTGVFLGTPINMG